MERYEKIAWNRRKWQLRILRKKAEKSKRKNKVWTIQEIEYLKEQVFRHWYKNWGWLENDPEDHLKGKIHNEWTIKADKGW